MSKTDNLTDFLTDVADAIREKKGSTEKINPQNFSDEIRCIQSGSNTPSTPTRPTYTGHADVEGLKAIGWTDEDIAYYQEHGVNWNEEDDEYHKVPEDNIALYGVLTDSNISTYRSKIVYLPKIDTSGRTSLNIQSCYSLVSIPQLDTSSVTSMDNMFSNCYSLVSIPQLDTTSVTSMYNMFYNCYSLVSIPQLETSSVTSMSSMFNDCYSLQSLNASGINQSLQIHKTDIFTKASLLYIINNEAAISAITITLSSYCYDKYSADADVVAALSNHPNISLAK